jgi:hypothetical protein
MKLVNQFDMYKTGIPMSNFQKIKEALADLRTLLLDERLKVKDLYMLQRAIAYVEYRIKVSDEYLTLPEIGIGVEERIQKTTKELMKFADSKSDAEFLAGKEHLLSAVKDSMGFVQVQNQTETTYLNDAIQANDSQLKSINERVEILSQSLQTLQNDATEFIQELKDEFHSLIEGTEDKVGWKQEVKDGLARIEIAFKNELHGDGLEKKGWVSKAEEVQLKLDSILTEGETLGTIIGVDGLTKKERQAAERVKVGWIAKKCEELLNSIGLGASVGGYQRRANAERFSGFMWTTCIVLLFVAVVAVNADILQFFEDHAGSSSVYEFLLFRLVASVPFIAFMTFAGFKAKSHRKMELKYRQFELELAAFEPNLSTLQKEVRSFAKLMFIQKTFGNFDDKSGTQELDLEALAKSINATKKAIESVGAEVKDLVKRTEDGN